MATGVISWTYDDGTDRVSQHCNVKKMIFNWTADGSGNAADTSLKLVGHFVKAMVIPGSPVPTVNYSIVITDPTGNNVLTACQTNLATNPTTTREVYFFVKDTSATPVALSFNPVVCDQLTITISGAGNASQGQLILFYSPQ